MSSLISSLTHEFTYSLTRIWDHSQISSFIYSIRAIPLLGEMTHDLIHSWVHCHELTHVLLFREFMNPSIQSWSHSCVQDWMNLWVTTWAHTLLSEWAMPFTHDLMSEWAHWWVHSQMGHSQAHSLISSLTHGSLMSYYFTHSWAYSLLFSDLMSSFIHSHELTHEWAR